MQDARRFLRYVIPGLVFVLEVSIYLFVSCRTELVEFINSWAEAWYVGFPITIFVGSGAIGFLLGVIYYVLCQYRPLRCLAVDHRPLIKDLTRNKWLKVRDRLDCRGVDMDCLTQRDAWRISNILWNERMEVSQRIKGAAPMIERLVDIMHSLGTSFIGSLTAFLVWSYAHHKLTGKPQFPYLILPAIVALIHYINWRKMVIDFQITSDTIMLDELKENPAVVNIAETGNIFLNALRAVCSSLKAKVQNLITRCCAKVTFLASKAKRKRNPKKIIRTTSNK